MQFLELRKSLRAKLELVERDCSGYLEYHLVISQRQIPLPTLIRISKVDGEIPDQIISSVACALGLSAQSLKEMVTCKVGKKCTYIAMCVRLFHFVVEQRHLQGESFRPGLEAMLYTIELLINELQQMRSGQWSEQESTVLEKVNFSLAEFMKDSDLSNVATRLNQLSSIAVKAE